MTAVPKPILGPHIDHDPRRRYPRRSFAARFEITSGKGTHVMQALDASRFGVRLQSASPVRDGTLATIVLLHDEVPPWQTTGEVKWHRKNESGFEVGIELDSPLPDLE